MDKYKQKVCTLTVSECSRTYQLTTNTQLMLIEHYCKNSVTSKHHSVLRCSKNTLFGRSEQYQPVVWLFLKVSSSLMHKNFQLCVSRRCIMLAYRTWSLLGVDSCPEKAPQVREALGHMSLCTVTSVTVGFVTLSRQIRSRVLCLWVLFTPWDTLWVIIARRRLCFFSSLKFFPKSTWNNF